MNWIKRTTNLIINCIFIGINLGACNFIFFHPVKYLRIFKLFSKNSNKLPVTYKHFYYITIFFIFMGFLQDTHGQFYNGHQMTFGKNRVQYFNFYWSYYRFNDFDVYFNQEGKELAQYTEVVAREKIKEVERFFDYSLDKRIIFLVFENLSDFRQSNLGLVTANDEYNVGGVTQIIQNKVSLFYQGNHREYNKQVKAAITRVVLNEMLYGNDIRENFTNSTLLNLPEWYQNGLTSYVSENWSIETENRVRDGILTERYKKFNRLTGEEAGYAGHSFWKYIADVYGEPVIPNIVYLTRVNKNVNSAFLYVLGIPLKDLSEEWLMYYKDKYEDPGEERKMPDTQLQKRFKKDIVTREVKLDPSGKYLAYTTNDLGRYKIFLYNLETGKKRKIFREGHRLEQITDYSYPVVEWHPSGRILTFITEEEGGLKLYYYTLATKELIKRNLLYFNKVIDYAFSHDGSKLVLSAVRFGKTDIYVHTLSSASNEQITNDLPDDLFPEFIDNSSGILFSSNRISDTLSFVDEQDLSNVGQSYDMFIYDYKSGSKVLLNLKEAAYVDNTRGEELSKNRFVFLSDRNGIVNRYMARFDSVISFIDTTTHYRYITKSYPVTNYARNILEHDISRKNKTVAEVIFHDGKYKLYKHDLNVEPDSYEGKFKTTTYREKLTSELNLKDSLARVKHQQEESLKSRLKQEAARDLIEKKEDPDEPIDINNYVFEKEKQDVTGSDNNNGGFLGRKSRAGEPVDTTRIRDPKIRIYETSFYTNYMVSQIDFSFLNASYQAFTGGAVYYNPGMNMLFKLGTNDLFEDYKIVGGVRFSGDFDSNEYLLSIENLKPRVDRQVLGHRQAFKNLTQDGELIKTHTHELMYILRYPFNQVSAVKGTGSIRNDRTVFLSTDVKSLARENIYKTWLGLKGEYIFDNTRSLGLNLYRGTRYKLFAEYFKQIDESKSDLWVLGADFRHYIKIHRSLIWANRLAGSTSFGHNRLIYYLGSVDNWINILPNRVQTFDNSVPINNREKYAYQTLATNMRGFTQNIRNGNNFAVFNSEIRWPIIRYFVNRPMSSAFLSNFQLVGFFDIGSAWTGLTPYSGENAYDDQVIENGPITVTIDSNREPIVAGYGYGIRTQILGYFVRLDWAYGIENKVILPRIFYLSLSLDF